MTEESGPFRAFLEGIEGQTARILDNIGITVNMPPWNPEYAALRDRIYAMPAWRRWLSFRLRRRLAALRLRQQQAFINAVLEKGEER